MRVTQDTAYVGELLDAYAATVWKTHVASEEPADGGVPPEMQAGEVDEEGWVEWRLLPSTDPVAVYLDDGSGTGVMVVIGKSLRDRLLYVVHVERGDRDRIISARPASGGEREVYESG